MSTAFRLLLLTVAASAVLWMYHLRSGDLGSWFGRHREEPLQPAAPGAARSPVDGVIGPREEEALVTIRGLEVAPRVRDGDWLRVLPSFPGVRAADRWEDPPAVRQEGEDLPFVEDLSDPWPEDVLGGGDGSAAPPWRGEGGSADGEPPAAREPLPPGGEHPGVSGSGEAPEPAETKPRTYRVEKGDSLWKIAAKLLGAGHRFPEIRKRDGGALDPAKLLTPGTELLVPGR